MYYPRLKAEFSRKFTAMIIFTVCFSGFLGLSHAAELTKPSFPGPKTSWHAGFDRYDYVMDQNTFTIDSVKATEKEGFGVAAPDQGKRRCLVVVPQKPAPGNPWLWRGCYWDHEPQTEVEMLKHGFHIAFITPDPDKAWDAWYTYLTEKHGLSTKPAFIGMSKGGVNSYEWATRNPDKVSCIYADNPAIRRGAFLKLPELAKRDVPLLNVCGNLDFLLEKNTNAIESFYHQLNGRITVVIKEGTAHHPHSLRNPKLAADWIQSNYKHDNPVRKPSFVDDSFTKSSYYSLDNTYFYLKEEDTYATGRGPAFTTCYDRYDVITSSQWGVGGMSVIVPKVAAKGYPWVFRADYITRDAAVDQALLAKGYHIVIAPLTAQSGAVQEQWDAVYERMTNYGFSRKPVMQGAGALAGEAYAWAIQNPDKVACIYAVNPILRSTMTKQSIMDNLASLANAKVPILHVCGSADPWLDSQTRPLQKQYQQLGAPIRVFINENKGHYPLIPDNLEDVVNDITQHAK